MKSKGYFIASLIIIQLNVAISMKQIELNLDTPLMVNQVDYLAQYKLNLIQKGYYYNIIVENINLSLKDMRSSLYLLVLVTSFQIDDTLKAADVWSHYQGKYQLDYDGFGLKSDTQIIKYQQQDDSNPIFISIYLQDKDGKLAQLDQSLVYASYTIQVKKQSTENYCVYACAKGTCNTQFTGCTCPPSIEKFYFDKKCEQFASEIKLDSEITESFLDKNKNYYIEISDISSSYSITFTSSYSGNVITFLEYKSDYTQFTIPNFVNDEINFKSSKTRELKFPKDWVAKQYLSNNKQAFRILFSLFNLYGGTSQFTLKFYSDDSISISEDMPSWAMYLFVALAILGLLFMIFVIIAIIRGQFRGINARMVRVGPIFVSQDIIEKYMPTMIYKEIDLNKEEQEDCIICLEGYKDDVKVRISICGHLYHKDCLDRWLVAHTNCPYCRQELTEKELESWLEKKLQEQMLKEQQKEFKSMLVQYLSEINNNENLKNILKICHQDQLQKRSFLSISNNNANLKKNFPDSSSISSIQTKQIQAPPVVQNKQPKSTRQKQKHKKQSKLHSQSFNIGYDLEVNIKDLINENILNSQSSNRKAIKNSNKNNKNILTEDDYNFPSNLLNNQDSEDNFNVILKRGSKNQKKKSTSNQVDQQSKKYDLESITEDFGEANLRESQINSHINSQVNLSKAMFKNKKRQLSQNTLKNTDDYPTTVQNFDYEQGMYTDKVESNLLNEIEQQQQQQQQNQKQNIIELPKVNNQAIDANISFGGQFKKSALFNEIDEDFDIERIISKPVIDNKIMFSSGNQLEQYNTSLNHFQDQTNYSLKQYDNIEKELGNLKEQKSQPQEINEMDYGQVRQAYD